VSTATAEAGVLQQLAANRKVVHCGGQVSVSFSGTSNASRITHHANPSSATSQRSHDATIKKMNLPVGVAGEAGRA
jgi:hypothetical protein